jgi:hypothetical protein
LLGGSVAGVEAIAGPATSASAATGAWNVNGNTGITSTNFIGPTNNAALIFKTAATAGSPIERARFQPGGAFWVKNNTSIGTPPSGTARLITLTANSSGIGVLGQAPNSVSNALTAIGAQGIGTVGVQGTGEYMGVQGNSQNYAVFGYTTPDTGGIGVYGRGSQGVKGRSYSGFAVYGDTDNGVGVRGESYSDGGGVIAVGGEAFGADSNGVVGTANNGAAAYGVWGQSSTGYAGVFSGKALVTGTLSKGGGSFKIDHPLDPANAYLYHSFVESPDMLNVYNGNVRTDSTGNATIELPDYFMELNRDFRYQLTVLGTFAQAIVSKEISNGQFEIRTDKPNTKVSWQVTGIRKDAWANANRIPVSEAKPAEERGLYLHPAAHGKPATMDIQHKRLHTIAAQRQHRGADITPTR